LLTVNHNPYFFSFQENLFKTATSIHSHLLIAFVNRESACSVETPSIAFATDTTTLRGVFLLQRLQFKSYDRKRETLPSFRQKPSRAPIIAVHLVNGSRSNNGGVGKGRWSVPGKNTDKRNDPMENKRNVRQL
jgi:hypothetical protein